MRRVPIAHPDAQTSRLVALRLAAILSSWRRLEGPSNRGATRPARRCPTRRSSAPAREPAEGARARSGGRGARLMDYPDPTLYAVPFFLVALAVEPALLRRARARGASVLGYEGRDTRASLGMGVVSLVFVSGINFGIYTAAAWLARWRVCDLGHGVLAWAVALVGWDLSYYWHHRAEHEIRLLWACHVNHHSSRRYNLSTALRQPWTPVAGLLFYPVWALAGVRPWMIMARRRVEPRLPVLGAHRGGRPHAAVVRGRLQHAVAPPGAPRLEPRVPRQELRRGAHRLGPVFGTFVEERAPVVYGLTKNLGSYNLWTIAFHEYGALARDVLAARGWRDRLGVLLRGPEWRPQSLPVP